METKNKKKQIVLNKEGEGERGGGGRRNKQTKQKISKIRVRSNSERFPPHIHCKTIHTCSEGGMNTCTDVTQHRALIMVGDNGFGL